MISMYGTIPMQSQQYQITPQEVFIDKYTLTKLMKRLVSMELYLQLVTSKRNLYDSI